MSSIKLGQQLTNTSVEDFCVSIGNLNGNCKDHSTIIGCNAAANHADSIVLGNGAQTTSAKQLVIALGDKTLKTNLNIDVGSNTLGVQISGGNYNIPLGPTGGSGGASVNSYPSFTTPGQITYAAGSDDGEHLPIGATGYYLASTGAVPEWKNTIRLGEGGFSTPAIEFGNNANGKDAVYIPSAGYISFLAGGVDEFLVQEDEGCYTPHRFTCKDLRVTNIGGGGNPAGYLLQSTGIAGAVVPTALQSVGSTRKFNSITTNNYVVPLTSDDSVNEIDFSSHNSSVVIDVANFALGSANTSHRGARFYVGDRGSNPATDLTVWCSTGSKIEGHILCETGIVPLVTENTFSYIGTSGFHTGDWFEIHPMHGKIIVTGMTAGGITSS